VVLLSRAGGALGTRWRSLVTPAAGDPAVGDSGGRVVPMPLFAASAGSSPTRGTGLPGGRSRAALAAAASGIGARSPDDARAVVSAGTAGVGSGDLLPSLASVDAGAGSGVSMMMS